MSHRMTKTILFAAACVCFVLGANLRSADAADREIVRFRLGSWKTVHFDDSKAADDLHATLNRLGCESKKHAHGDHIDVTYRCPAWRAIALQTHDEAHRWERWLQAVGFQTTHEH